MKIVEHIVKKVHENKNAFTERTSTWPSWFFFANYQHLTFTFSEPSWHHLSFVWVSARRLHHRLLTCKISMFASMSLTRFLLWMRSFVHLKFQNERWFRNKIFTASSLNENRASPFIFKLVFARCLVDSIWWYFHQTLQLMSAWKLFKD